MDIINSFLKVKDIMNVKFLKVPQNTKIKKVFNAMIKNNMDEVLIVDEYKNLTGIFTRKNLSQLDYKNEELMEEPIFKYSIKNIVTISPDAYAREARDIMIEHNIGRLPVVQHGNVKGIITSINLRDNFYIKVDEMFNLQNDVLNNIHEAICICDGRGIITYWNKSSEKLYEIKAQEVIGKHISTHFCNAIILKVLNEGKAIENVKHEPIKGKTVILSAVPVINSDKKVVAVVSTDRDVTEVENLSKKLHSANEKVEMLSHAYNREIANNYKFSSIVGKSKKIISSINMCQKIASTSTSVLITGESGTGKEVFAKSIHEASGRKGQFVAVNCSAIPEQLLESELFGYVDGAFTGAAKKGKIGMFEFANNGTLFLDEIGDMPIGMQSKLLRVLQDGIVYRLGSEKPIHTNTRIIAATNKNLRQAIKNNEFRDDLFYRLAVVQVELPPLRERKEDIRDLINLFINQVSHHEKINIDKIDDEVYEILSNYKWEGNIRELKNVVQRMVVLSINGVVSLESIPPYILKEKNELFQKDSCKDCYDLDNRVKDLEISLITKAMELTEGNKAKAAEILKIKRTTLYYKLKQYGLESSET